MANSKESFFTVLCTVPDRKTAQSLARTMVDEKLAACCNILPGITSVYRWKGEIHEDPELLLLFKTSAPLFPKLKKRIQTLHPYEVPEIIALKIETGNFDYLKWVTENVQNTAKG